jgi:putative transposase
MSRLQHRIVPAFTYFVTTKTWQSHAILQVPLHAEIVLECVLRHQEAGAYLLHEFVVMPNHLHLLMTLAGNASLEKAMQLIKGGSSHEIHKRNGSKFPIWQSGFHEESVRDILDFQVKAKYIHENAVHARLAENPADYPYSSASGAFRLDAPPERLKVYSSAAEAVVGGGGGMSELKLRPPKRLS